jgi:orotate phosphoribosyltransferase
VNNDNDPEIMRLFSDVGAIVTNSHFVYTSGRHSSVYVNKDAVYAHTSIIASLCKRMAQPYDPNTIDVVVGPVLGGIVLSQWVTHALNQRRTTGETLAVFAEKATDGVNKHFFFGRGYEKVIPGRNVLIVEDLLTTGGSVRQVVETVRNVGGNIIGISVLCNRGNVQPEDIDNVPINALISLSLQTYSAEDCPFCKQRVPINTVLGKGRAYLAKQSAEKGS